MSALAEMGISPVYTGQSSWHFSAAGGRCLALPGQHARVFGVTVNTAATGGVVYVYDGISANGTLIAQIDASAKGAYVFGGVRCPAGIYINVLGATVDVTVNYEGQDTSGDLTLSGNEITDVTRAAGAFLTTASSGQMEDGQTVPDSSFGIRRTATNLFRRGQCDAVTDWSVAGTVSPTVAIDATTPAPFSPQSIKYTTSGSGTGEGANAISATGQAAVAGTVGVGSIYFQGVLGATYKARVDWKHTDGTFAVGVETSFNGTGAGAWQLIAPAGTAVTAAKTGDILEMKVYTAAARAESFWVAHAMLEASQSVVAPYVATTGGATGTHVRSTVTAPASLASSSGGWFAARVRMGIDPTLAGYTAGDGPTVATFGDSDTECFRLYYRAADAAWRMRALHGGGAADVLIGQAITPGQILSIVGYWTTTQLGLSVNGSVFVKGNIGSFFPTTLAPSLCIGTSAGGGSQINGDSFWVALGTGTLTDADAALFNSWGNTDPLPSWFPTAANVTMVWPANTSQYLTP